MKKIGAFLIGALLLIFVFSGCSAASLDFNFVDGKYAAEFSSFDSSGYKEYLHVTVENGVVTSVEYDAIDQEGNLRSSDEQYKADMEAFEGTYPDQYVKDLVNQYMEKHDISQVDVVAGATFASENFVSLFLALEPNMTSGTNSVVILENPNP